MYQNPCLLVVVLIQTMYIYIQRIHLSSMVEPKNFLRGSMLNISLYSGILNFLNINVYGYILEYIYIYMSVRVCLKESYFYIFINLCFKHS
mgnify:CR=1 FL=1